jgi:hypothetical protein
MHKNATKCNKTQNKWCINKHGASKIIDTFETYHMARAAVLAAIGIGSRVSIAISSAFSFSTLDARAC